MCALVVVQVAIARATLFGGLGSLGGMLSEIVVVLAVIGVVELLLFRWRLLAYAVTAALLSFGLLAVVLYASYAERLPAISSLRFAGEVWAVRSSVAALFSPGYAVFLVGVALPLVALVVVWRPATSLGSQTRDRVTAVVALVSLAVCIVLVSGTMTAAASEDSMQAARTHGLLAYEVASVKQSPVKPPAGSDPDFKISWSSSETADASGAKNASSETARLQDKVDAILDPQRSSQGGSITPGAFRGANVIAIQIESMQQFPLGMDIDGIQVTPNLNELIGESWYFPNAFSQIGPGTTSDAEFVMNSSLYAPRNDPASVAFAGRRIPALPRLLSAKGYQTFTMHANTVKFWNREQLYPALGFERYYDRQFFGTADTVGMGMSDGLMLKKAWPVILEASKKGPFYSQIITLSPHHPFELPQSKVTMPLPQWLSGTILGSYLESMNYEDRCIGWLIRQLKDEGIWDRSIVVVYGDHFGLRQKDLVVGSNQDLYDILLGHPYTPLDKSNIPLIVHMPGQSEGHVLAKAVGQVDIMPTIAEALGLDLSRVPHFGRSVFEGGRPLLPENAGVPMGSFVNGQIFYSGGGTDFSEGTAVSLATRRKIDLPEAARSEWLDAASLLHLADEYTKSLPKTGSATTPADAILPGRVK